MLNAIMPMLTILSGLMPLIQAAAAGAPTVASVLQVLGPMIKTATTEAPTMIAPIQRVINDLRATGVPTKDELAELDAYDDTLSATFEAGAAAAGDPAPAV